PRLSPDLQAAGGDLELRERHARASGEPMEWTLEVCGERSSPCPDPLVSEQPASEAAGIVDASSADVEREPTRRPERGEINRSAGDRGLHGPRPKDPLLQPRALYGERCAHPVTGSESHRRARGAYTANSQRTGIERRIPRLDPPLPHARGQVRRTGAADAAENIDAGDPPPQVRVRIGGVKEPLHRQLPWIELAEGHQQLPLDSSGDRNSRAADRDAVQARLAGSDEDLPERFQVEGTGELRRSVHAPLIDPDLAHFGSCDVLQPDGEQPVTPVGKLVVGSLFAERQLLETGDHRKAAQATQRHLDGTQTAPDCELDPANVHGGGMKEPRLKLPDGDRARHLVESKTPLHRTVLPGQHQAARMHAPRPPGPCRPVLEVDLRRVRIDQVAEERRPEEHLRSEQPQTPCAGERQDDSAHRSEGKRAGASIADGSHLASSNGTRRDFPQLTRLRSAPLPAAPWRRPNGRKRPAGTTADSREVRSPGIWRWGADRPGPSSAASRAASRRRGIVPRR